MTGHEPTQTCLPLVPIGATSKWCVIDCLAKYPRGQIPLVHTLLVDIVTHTDFEDCLELTGSMDSQGLAVSIP